MARLLGIPGDLLGLGHSGCPIFWLINWRGLIDYLNLYSLFATLSKQAYYLCSQCVIADDDRNRLPL